VCPSSVTFVVSFHEPFPAWYGLFSRYHITFWNRWSVFSLYQSFSVTAKNIQRINIKYSWNEPPSSFLANLSVFVPPSYCGQWIIVVALYPYRSNVRSPKIDQHLWVQCRSLWLTRYQNRSRDGPSLNTFQFKNIITYSLSPVWFSIMLSEWTFLFFIILSRLQPFLKKSTFLKL